MKTERIKTPIKQLQKELKGKYPFCDEPIIEYEIDLELKRSRSERIRNMFKNLYN